MRREDLIIRRVLAVVVAVLLVAVAVAVVAATWQVATEPPTRVAPSPGAGTLTWVDESGVYVWCPDGWTDRECGA